MKETRVVVDTAPQELVSIVEQEDKIEEAQEENEKESMRQPVNIREEGLEAIVTKRVDTEENMFHSLLLASLPRGTRKFRYPACLVKEKASLLIFKFVGGN